MDEARGGGLGGRKKKCEEGCGCGCTSKGRQFTRKADGVIFFLLLSRQVRSSLNCSLEVLQKRWVPGPGIEFGCGHEVPHYQARVLFTCWIYRTITAKLRLYQNPF